MKVIVVAMHHTHKVDYTIPSKTRLSGCELVHVLFHETKGLLRCPINKQAIKSLRKQVSSASKLHCNCSESEPKVDQK